MKIIACQATLAFVFETKLLVYNVHLCGVCYKSWLHWPLSVSTCWHQLSLSTRCQSKLNLFLCSAPRVTSCVRTARRTPPWCTAHSAGSDWRQTAAETELLRRSLALSSRGRRPMSNLVQTSPKYIENLLWTLLWVHWCVLWEKLQQQVSRGGSK